MTDFHSDIANKLASEDLIRSLIRKWAGLLRKAAKRFTVSGKLDEEDLVQEGAMILWQMVTEFPHWEGKGDKFRKVFKTRLWHRMSDLNAFWRTKGRSVKKEIPINEYGSTVTGAAGTRKKRDFFSINEGGFRVCKRKFNDPQQLAQHEELLRTFESRLSEFARPLWLMIISPTPELKAAYERYLSERGIKKRKKLPINVYADALGSTYKITRRALKEIRRLYCEIFERTDLSELAVA